MPLLVLFYNQWSLRMKPVDLLLYQLTQLTGLSLTLVVPFLESTPLVTQWSKRPLCEKFTNGILSNCLAKKKNVLVIMVAAPCFQIHQINLIVQVPKLDDQDWLNYKLFLSTSLCNSIYASFTSMVHTFYSFVNM